MTASRYRFPVLAVIAIAALASVGWLYLGPAWRAVPAPVGSVIQAHDLKARAAPVNAAPPPVAGLAPQPPARLVINSIGVDASVEAVGVDAGNFMGLPSKSADVGWYKLGPTPGEPGDAVIDGHFDWFDTSRAVFFNLKAVKVGDDIVVQRVDRVTRHFKVTGVQSVPYNATVPGLFSTTGPARLSLITCGGAWDQKLGQYLQRTVVDAALVSAGRSPG